MSRDGPFKGQSSNARGRGQNQGRANSWGRRQGGSFFGSRATMLNRGPLRVTNRPSSFKIAKASPKLSLFFPRNQEHTQFKKLETWRESISAFGVLGLV